MPSRIFAVAVLLSVAFLPGCSNTLNPLCGSARPAPVIGALSPSTVSFSDVQQGAVLTITGSHFVSASEVLIDGTTISANVTSDQQLTVPLTSGVISGPGTVNVSVKTPSGNSGDVGCTSGGTSSQLALTVN